MQLRPHVGLDLGTHSTKAVTGDRAVTLPSRVIRHPDGTYETASDWGHVRFILRDTEDGRQIVQPIQGGVLTDYRAGERLITDVLSQLLPWWTLLRPAVTVNRSSLASRAQIKQVRQAVRVAGARSVYTANEITLSALGAGVDPSASRGRLVVDIGAGSTQAAVMVHGSTTAQRARSIGGQDLSAAICDRVRSVFGVGIDSCRARQLLAGVGSAVGKDQPEWRAVPVAGGSCTVSISSNHIATAIDAEIEKITDLLRTLMENTSTALLADIADSGLLLVGGVARLRNLDTRMSRRLSLPVAVADQPNCAVVRGAKQTRRYISAYQKQPEANAL